MKFLFTCIISALLILACGNKNKFQSDTETKKEAEGEVVEPVPTEEAVAEKAQPPAPPEPKSLSFTIKAEAYGEEPVDYLFVIDNSSSMGNIIKTMRSNLTGLASKFPANSRAAVMNTLIADPSDYTKLWSDFMNGKENQLEHDPGFLKLMNREGIINARDNGSDTYDIEGRFDLSGCNESWFHPTAKSPEGESCFEAALQIALVGMGSEAGITALKQMLEKHNVANKKLFRENSYVNIIFVSDTHDPGWGVTLNSPNYTVPTLENVNKLLKLNHKVKGIKYHAIAPETQCDKSEGQQDLMKKSYFSFVDQSQGEKLDMCVENDYSSIIETIASSYKSSFDFDLGENAKMDQLTIKVTKADGTAVEHKASIAGKTLTISGINYSADFLEDLAVSVEIAPKN